MDERDEMYCTLCQGRGLDKYDQLCRKCDGTGFEPGDVSTRRTNHLTERVLNYGHKDIHSRPYRR